MRVLAACSLGGSGHLNPLLPLLAAARRRGDEILVVGPPSMGELVARAGHLFRPGGEPPESVIAPIRERLPIEPPAVAAVLGNRELFGRLATAAMLPAMKEVVGGWLPELVLRDPCEYASAVIAHGRGIPTAQVAISLAAAEAGSIAVAGPALDEHRPGLAGELLATPYLTRFPATLDPSPFPTTVRYREARDPVSEPLPDWWGGSTAPLVYMTFGTVLGYLSIAADVYRTTLRAVDGFGWRVLLTVGRQFDPSTLGPVPSNVHVESWVDQSRVLAHADLVLCHGGSGTVFGTLAAGVPLVVVPVFADQFENGARIEAHGAGLTVARHGADDGNHAVVRDDDAPRIAAAMREVMGDPSFRSQARAMAAEMAATPTVDAALDAILCR